MHWTRKAGELYFKMRKKYSDQPRDGMKDSRPEERLFGSLYRWRRVTTHFNFHWEIFKDCLTTLLLFLSPPLITSSNYIENSSHYFLFWKWESTCYAERNHFPSIASKPSKLFCGRFNADEILLHFNGVLHFLDFCI